jgi:hypothetical protein
MTLVMTLCLMLQACSDKVTEPGETPQGEPVSQEKRALSSEAFASSSSPGGHQANFSIAGQTIPFIRVAGIGGNFGNRAANAVFSTGDLTGSVTRISEAAFNAMSVSEVRAAYDVLLFTWASSWTLNADWNTRLLPYLQLGGGIIWEDDGNLSDLAPAITAVNVGAGGPWTVAPVPGLSDGISGAFANTHIRFTSWTGPLLPYITSSGGTEGLYGEFSGGGRIVLHGPDHDFHSARPSNQYNLLVNEIRWVTSGSTPNQVGPWSATGDFSASRNPNGPWLAGWTPTLGGPLTRFNTLASVGGTLAAWLDPSINVSSTPTFAKNVGTSAYLGISPGEVMLHPGCRANEVAVLRWVAPAPGAYEVAGQFSAGDVRDMPAWIIRNGDPADPLFRAPSTNGNPAFSVPVILTADEYLDFAVGVGSDCGNGSTVLSATITKTILDQTITLDALADKTYGDDDFTVSAAASSGLPVSLTAAGKCTVSGSTVHLTGAGSCTITASQAGDANYNPAPDVSRTFQIAKAVATLALSDLTHTYDAEPKTAVVTTTPVGLSGVALTYDGAAMPPTNAGSYAVLATLTHDDYEATPATGTLTILPATPTITWTPVTPIFLGTPLGGDQLNAAAMGVAGASVTGNFEYTPASGTVLDAGPAHQLSVQFTSADANYTGATKTVVIAVHYRFSGFFRPVENPEIVNTARAGSAIPVKLGLAGDQGLNVFDNGSPASASYTCGSTGSENSIVETSTAGNSSLSYDPATDQYTYVWKTNGAWASSCRRLTVTLRDGTRHHALFHFK